MPNCRSTICMPGIDLVALERDVGDAIDLDAGGDFHIQAGHALRRQEALRDRRQERRVLRLHAVEENVSSKIDFGHG